MVVALPGAGARGWSTEGHEIGVHTFTHPDLSYQSTSSAIDWELAQTQLALAGAAGIRTLAVPAAVLLRVADAMDDQHLAGDRSTSAASGYITVVRRHRQRGLAAARRRRDHPQRHARRTARARSSSCTTPAATARQTVAALDRYIPGCRRAGYTFTTVTEALDAPQRAHRRSPASSCGRAGRWICGRSQAAEHATAGPGRRRSAVVGVAGHRPLRADAACLAWRHARRAAAATSAGARRSPSRCR